jgi:hypothetical protein
MSPYEEALLVTARVTAGLFLAGCGGSIATPDPAPQPTSTSQPPAKATASSPMPDPSQKPLGLACDPPETECCTAILDRIEADWSQYSKTDPKVLSQCCNIDNNKTRPACTPWGPPMPPAMVLS